MSDGPQPLSHTERWALAEGIAQELHTHYGTRLLALGVYGSLARGNDGPYSDIEMHCVVRGERIETSFEWSTGPWKAEVDVYSPDVLFQDASFVDGDWPITHGAFVTVKPIYDPNGLFDKLRRVTLSQPAVVFKDRVTEVIVGEIYELVGKIRNACQAQAHDLLAGFISQLAIWGACILGLHHHQLFTSKSSMFQEALALPDIPDGFQALVHRVRRGELSQPAILLETTNRYWTSLVTWAERNHYSTNTSLKALLSASEPESTS
jgi:kanamycin nucleotidyltransferase